MKSEIDKTESGWWNQEWCPLFGALPSCELRDDVSEKCLAIITAARYILGTNRYVSSMIKNPDPEIIQKNTGYPVSLINGARMLVHCCSAHDILFDAQFYQGHHSEGNAYIKGRDRSYLIYDVDQLDISILNDAITARADLSQEFKEAFTDNPYEPTEENWKYPIVTPVMTFALMSITVAWDTFKYVSDGSMKPKSRDAVNELLTAQKLLHTAERLRADAERLRADESQQHIYQIKNKPVIAGRAGGLASTITRGDKADVRNADWQKRADELWKTHPFYSKKSIANLIAGETGNKMDPIRRNIQKKQ